MCHGSYQGAALMCVCVCACVCGVVCMCRVAGVLVGEATAPWPVRLYLIIVIWLGWWREQEDFDRVVRRQLPSGGATEDNAGSGTAGTASADSAAAADDSKAEDAPAASASQSGVDSVLSLDPTNDRAPFRSCEWAHAADGVMVAVKPRGVVTSFTEFMVVDIHCTCCAVVLPSLHHHYLSHARAWHGRCDSSQATDASPAAGHTTCCRTATLAGRRHLAWSQASPFAWRRLCAWRRSP